MERIAYADTVIDGIAREPSPTVPSRRAGMVEMELDWDDEPSPSYVCIMTETTYQLRVAA